MIDDKVLRAHGYNKLDIKITPAVIQRHSDVMYQKLVRDGKVKKYFINVYFYANDILPQYEFELYSHLSNDVATHTIFYGIDENMSIEEIEKMIDDFFTNTNMKVYDDGDYDEEI